MSVMTKRILKYVCMCDVCGKVVEVSSFGRIYNAAQAVRSLKWSYGRDGFVRCCNCRITRSKDHYRDRIYSAP